MANARRVIFGTYVIPTQIKEMEETTVTQEEFQANVGKALGGKGTAAINGAQWGDQWTSTTHGTINKWEEFTDVLWQDVFLYPKKSGRLSIGTSPTQLTSDVTDCAFLYIKNLGSIKLLVALDETGLAGGGSTDGNYYIEIPSEGSISLRGDGTNLECKEVYVKSSSSTTEIEYLIAQE